MFHPIAKRQNGAHKKREMGINCARIRSLVCTAWKLTSLICNT
jgi:hypothetical protein